jgi:hypothetical protein
MAGTIDTLSELHDALTIFERNFDPDKPTLEALGYFAKEIWHKCEALIPILQGHGIDTAAMDDLRNTNFVTLARIRACDIAVVGAILSIEGNAATLSALRVDPILLAITMKMKAIRDGEKLSVRAAAKAAGMSNHSTLYNHWLWQSITNGEGLLKRKGKTK